MSNNPYKSYREITTEIETYGNSADTLGNVPSLYKPGLAISSINQTDYDYKFVKTITDDLIQKINMLKTEYSKSCGEGGVGASKCQKKVRACESLLGNLNLVSGKVSRTPQGGSRRKTMKGRRKNKSRRNRKSRR